MHDAYIFTKHDVSFYVTEADILLGDELSDSDGELRFTFGPLKMKRALSRGGRTSPRAVVITFKALLKIFSFKLLFCTSL